MKISGYFLMILIVLHLNNKCFTQKIDYPYEVGTWQGFRTSAITYTFDDNCSNQLALAVPMFNEFNFKLTLFTVINWGPNWAGLQNAVLKGHEIGSHTLSHASLNSLTSSPQINEMKNSRDEINSRLANQKCVTIAYPNCRTGDYSIVSQFYFAARGCQGYIESTTPSDFMNTSSIVCGSLGSVKTVADFNSYADRAAHDRGWCVYLIHGIDNDGGYSPLSSTVLRTSLEYLKANSEIFWVSTFGDVAKYIKERNLLSIIEISNKEDSITIKVTDTLDNSYYNCPVTIRRPLPLNWTSSEVRVNGKNISSKITEINSVKYIMFDVIPDNGDITLVKNGATGIERSVNSFSNGRLNLYQNYPNPFNIGTAIKYHLSKSSFVSLKVFDLLGNEVAVLVNEIQTPGSKTVNFNAANLPSGMYLYRIQTGEFSEAKRFVLLK